MCRGRNRLTTCWRLEVTWCDSAGKCHAKLPPWGRVDLILTTTFFNLGTHWSRHQRPRHEIYRPTAVIKATECLLPLLSRTYIMVKNKLLLDKQLLSLKFNSGLFLSKSRSEIRNQDGFVDVDTSFFYTSLFVRIYYQKRNQAGTMPGFFCGINFSSCHRRSIE